MYHCAWFEWQSYPVRMTVKWQVVCSFQLQRIRTACALWTFTVGIFTRRNWPCVASWSNEKNNNIKRVSRVVNWNTKTPNVRVWWRKYCDGLNLDTPNVSRTAWGWSLQPVGVGTVCFVPLCACPWFGHGGWDYGLTPSNNMRIMVTYWKKPSWLLVSTMANNRINTGFIVHRVIKVQRK